MQEQFLSALQGHHLLAQVAKLTFSETLKHVQHSRKLERKKKSQKGHEARREFSLIRLFVGGYREPRPEQ